MYWVTGGRKLILSAKGKYLSHREGTLRSGTCNTVSSVLYGLGREKVREG